MVKTFALAILLSASALAAPAMAGVTLSNVGTGSDISSFGAGGGSIAYGQVFTAPITGTLTSFTLSLNGGVGGLYGAVGTWNGTSAFGTGFGSPTLLYKTADVASTGAADYTFSPNINVTAGSRYVAYLSVFGVSSVNATTSMPLGTSPTGIEYFVWNNDTNPDGNASWNYFADFGDAKFSATFGAVPEPASWAMLIAGFGLTGAAMRRRRVVVAA